MRLFILPLALAAALALSSAAVAAEGRVPPAAP
jgi:hypothetical protein